MFGSFRGATVIPTSVRMGNYRRAGGGAINVGQEQGGGVLGQYLQPGAMNITAPSQATAGTLERAGRSREFNMSNAMSQVGQAVAGGAFGDTRGALTGAMQAGNQGGMQAGMAGDALVEADLGRQLAALQGNQSTLLGQGRLSLDSLLGQQQLGLQAQEQAYRNAIRDRIFRLLATDNLALGPGTTRPTINNAVGFLASTL